MPSNTSDLASVFFLPNAHCVGLGQVYGKFLVKPFGGCIKLLCLVLNQHVSLVAATS